MTDRDAAMRVLAALGQTPIGTDAVLVGSSALFGFPTRVPALTEDVDVAVPTRVVEDRGGQIVRALAALGWSHPPGTATFIGSDGTAFDLLGRSDGVGPDRVSTPGPLRVLEFRDLSRLLAAPEATQSLGGVFRTLSPAGFAASKLLTERDSKGAKDKIQALLVIDEHRGDPGFAPALASLLGAFDEERIEDARASAQAAFLYLARDPAFADSGAEGYADVSPRVEAGYAELERALRGRRA